MFNFFRIVSSDTKVNLKSKIKAFCFNSKYKIFFYSNGDAHIFSEDSECTIFHIKDEVQFCCIPEGCNIFITLCQSLATNKSVLKIFTISKNTRKSPSIISNTELENACKVTIFNAFNLFGAELCIAIGLHNGNILLYKSGISKEILQKTLKCLNVCSRPIKGIEFSQYKDEVNIFTCSDDGVFYYKLFSKTIFNEIKVYLDDIVSVVHCCTLKPISILNNEEYFIVARDDGLYCYTKEGRGPCYALNGQKKLIEWFQKKYIIVLNAIDAWKTQDNNIYQLVIIDIDNKIIVLNKELYNVVSIQTIYNPPNCLIFLENGDIMTLKEKGIRYKIKHLIRKNMYDMAIKLLEECNENPETVADVLVSYGDHLIHRGDMFGAVKIFSKTIGVVSPFTIVNKLSDFRHNECLIEYLNLLNLTDSKSFEHLKLLKNCRQRIELPDRAINIFEEVNECEKLLVGCRAIEQSEKISSILAVLRQNKNMLTYLKILSNKEIIEFLSEYGYFLIRQYPKDFIGTAKYLLTEHFSTDQNKIYQIILPLLLLNKILANNLIDALCKQHKIKFFYNFWTELNLQMWQKGNFNIESVVNYFEINQVEISIDNAFIICRIYEFWPGVTMMYNKCGLQILSMKCLAKSFEMYPLYINEFSNEYSYHSNQMLVRSLRKDDLLSNYSFKLMSEIFKRIIKTSPYYILNILGDFMTNNNIVLSHFNDFFLDDNIFQHFKSTELDKKVSLLEEKVFNTKNILQKFNNRPIEFRSRSCEVCKQMTKLPTLFFLCQHSFHKECIRQYSDFLVCLVCSNNRKLSSILKPQMQDIQYNPNKISLQQNISKKLKRSILNNNTKQPSNLFKNCNTKLEDSKNVAKNYDDNLNPFYVKK